MPPSKWSWVSQRQVSGFWIVVIDSFAAITAFVHAVEQGSYVTAARTAHVSPSAIGKSVARLEERLGLRLLNRTTRSLSLTADGAEFYARCKRILSELEEAQLSLTEGRTRARGRLRVSAPHIFGHHLLMPILPLFTEQFPEIELDVDFDDRLVDLAADGVDVAVRSGELADAGLIARRIGEQNFVVCASQAYITSHGRPVLPSDLSGHSCIHFRYPTSGRLAPWAFAQPYDRLSLPSSLTFNNTDAGLRAALDGLGLAHLPVYVAEPHLRSGALVPVLVEHMVPFGALSLIWPSNRQLAPKVRVFVDFVIEHLAAHPSAFKPAAIFLDDLPPDATRGR
jgi:DNA-binding transcriptional LysR family regulator